MIRFAICLGLLSFGAALTPASAAEKLSFRTLEYDQPRDPLVGSNIVFSEVHHSPAGQIEPALAALTAAIPAGTPLADGEAKLRKAGARCSNSGTCTYRDIETVDENLDDILWTVALASTDGKVSAISVDRAWQRH